MDCYVKRIFLATVTCTLARTQGKTLIYVTLPSPPPYDHGPFLIRVTNVNPLVLFTAPTREGNFLFNLTFSGAAGTMIEQSNSYMTINGP